MCSNREPFHALLPLLCHVVPLNDGNCRLTMPVGKGRCARDALPHWGHGEADCDISACLYSFLRFLPQ